MLTRLRNAIAAHKESVDVPYSKMKYALAVLLHREGYVAGVVVAANKLTFRMQLRYTLSGEPIVRDVCRISKPGRRTYIAKDKIPTVLSGFGIAILSTSRGLMTGKEARKLGVGGEFICTIA